MIIGLGSDIVDVRRIADVIERHGERFLGRIFTTTERNKAEGRANTVETYAKRFAAKEACSKALGTGLRRGVFWRDMGVVNLAGGRPTMKLTASHRHYFRDPCTGGNTLKIGPLIGSNVCHVLGLFIACPCISRYKVAG
jgi:holo-[acyl-carrier protein] synthase